MAQNLDELVKVLELLGETKGAMPMPKALGKGRPSGWQKGVERMLEEYNLAAKNATANVEIPRGLQTASGGPLVPQNNLPARQALESYNPSAVSKEMTLPSAKAAPKQIEQSILAEAVELPPVIKGARVSPDDLLRSKGFSDEFLAKVFPSSATLESQLANTMFDATGAGSIGNVLGKISPKAKAAIPTLDALLGKMKPVLDMGKLGSMDKAIAKEANIAAKNAAANSLKQGLEKVGAEAAEAAAKGTAKDAIKSASKMGKLGKIIAGLGAAGLFGAYMMGDAGQGLEQEQTGVAPQQPAGPSMQDMLLAQMMQGGNGRSSELDKALSAMANQVRINAANAERQNIVANAIAKASGQVSDKL